MESLIPISVGYGVQVLLLLITEDVVIVQIFIDLYVELME